MAGGCGVGSLGMFGGGVSANISSLNSAPPEPRGLQNEHGQTPKMAEGCN